MYDAMILRVRELLKGLPGKVYAYEEQRAWPENHDFEMIFQKDVAFELGGGKTSSANLTCVTKDAKIFESGRKTDSQICVYGPDLQEIQGDVSYARLCEVLVKSDADLQENRDAGRLLGLLQDIDFEKFHVYGKGFMMRTSGQSAREPVRVSKKALRD